MAKAETKDLVVVDVGKWVPVATDVKEISAMLRDNLGTDKISIRDLVRVTVPAGGVTSFTMKALEGEYETKEITGVIIAVMNTRAYWSGEYTGQGSPPDCVSLDSCTGMGTPGGECMQCPYSLFGSAKDGASRGQACKQRRLLFLALPDEVFPLILDLPPTSLKTTGEYLRNLVTMGKVRMYQVVTSFTMRKEKNKDGIAYGQVQCRMVQKLSPDMAEKFAALNKFYSSVISRQSATDIADYAAENTDPVE